jgi:hypothetical protein
MPLPEISMKRHLAWLALILFATLLLRLPNLWWGLPPPLPHVIASDIRCSYAFDEDDVLTAVSFSNPKALDFDPRDYHWGALHLHLLQIWMEGAEAAGAFGRPWRDAYYHMRADSFEQVYAIGRLLSAVVSLLGIGAVFLLARQAGGISAALWAAALAAVSPAYLMASTQIRVDATMFALLVLAVWLAIRAAGAASPFLLLLTGIAAGLAFSAKHIAALTLAPVIVFVLWRQRGRFPVVAWLAAGAFVGFSLGEPYAVWNWRETYRVSSKILHANLSPPPEFAIPASVLLAKHAVNTARFAMGLPAFLLAMAGLFLMIRRRSAADVGVLLALAGTVAGLVLLSWPLLRYELPLVAFLSVAAGVALARLRPRLSIALGTIALAFPFFASLAQSAYMRAPHPANQALTLILKETPAGVPISRLAAELPPLDRKVYPMGPNPFLADITHDSPAWVLTADLPEQDYPATTRNTLAEHYELRGDFGIPRRFAWATLGEWFAPHDWKYTHPRMALYRRRDP